LVTKIRDELLDSTVLPPGQPEEPQADNSEPRCNLAKTAKSHEQLDTTQPPISPRDLISARASIGPARVTEGLKVSASDIAHRFGITVRTFDRWLLRPDLGFPRPTVIIRRRYWELSEIQAWERKQAAKGATRTA
jgi:hypothetical protein